MSIRDRWYYVEVIKDESAFETSRQVQVLCYVWFRDLIVFDNYVVLIWWKEIVSSKLYYIQTDFTNI